MKNRERILKYLSDLMNPEEQLKFEKELAQFADLYEEFTSIKEHLAEIKGYAGVDADERYFNSLLPRVRKRLEKPKRSFVPKLSIATAASVVILLISLFYFPKFAPTNDGGENQVLDINTVLASADSGALDELFDNNYIHEYTAYYDKSFLEEISDFLDDINFNSSQDNKVSADIYYTGTTTELLNTMTSEEMEDVYQALLNKKIL